MNCESGLSSDCTGGGDWAHHRQMRSQGGPDLEFNILHVCVHCHNYIHAHPETAYNMGQLVKSWDDPEKVAVVTVNR